MRKAMFSAPMAGRTDEQIDRVRTKAKSTLESMGYEFVNTVFRTEPEFTLEAMAARGVQNIPLHYLGYSLVNMSKCDAILFCRGWENARGCLVEHEAAKKYGVLILYEDALPIARPEPEPEESPVEE